MIKKLSVFRGGFTRPAAESIAGATLHALMTLVNKSLIHPDDTSRYHIHELLRQYGAEKLVESEEMEQIQDHHLTFFLGLAEEAEPQLEGSDQATWLKRLEAEHDNLRAALAWSRNEKSTAEFGLRLTSSLALFWKGRSYMSEGREQLALALARPSASHRTEARAKTLFEAGRLASEQGDYAEAQALLQESLSIYRELGPDGQYGLARVLVTLSFTQVEMGNFATAYSLLEEALSIMRALQDEQGIAGALFHLGWCAVRQGRYEQATRSFEEVVPIYCRLGHKNGLTYVLAGLGEIALRQDDDEQAIALLEESVALSRELGANWRVAASLGTLGWVALRRGDLTQAVTLLRESLTLRREVNDRAGGIAWCLEKLAEIALTRGRQQTPQRAEDFQHAARLFGTAEALRESIGSVIDLVDQPEYERQIASLTEQLDEATFTAAWTEGRTMTQEQAIDYALAVDLIS
ncbi:tetratricopeptide repeat protein [Chloroflexi bacterium TSY]|nr:tetratricopeptide repeat protein [Chloroflexi bacterium TSY]